MTYEQAQIAAGTARAIRNHGSLTNYFVQKLESGIAIMKPAPQSESADITERKIERRAKLIRMLEWARGRQSR